MEYRKEVDGLRAIAVIPVILFHAGINFFEGGFVGVDIFFVISGYLITSLILSEKSKGVFKLSNFYERRARRILPALFTVMLFSIPFSYFLMMPNQLLDFSESILAVTFFSSNILFWTETNYFSAAAELKPLLHTWSLAVEEQFYILFPLFIILTWKIGKQNIFRLILIFLIFSFLLSEWVYRFSPTANFFLAPTRAWELLIGSVAAFYLIKNKPVITKSKEHLATIGFVLILFSIFSFNANTPFPGVYSLVPVLGTLLIILYSSSNTFIGKFLSFNFIVGIGLISYSAYLWHQPFLAFSRLYFHETLSQSFLLIICIISFVFAYFSWIMIEKPYRNRQKISKRFLIFSIIPCVFVFITFSTIGIKSQGFIDNKLTMEDQEYLKNYKGLELSKAEYREECNFYEQGQNIDPSCYKEIPSKENVLIWGDSHAQAIGPGLRHHFNKKYNFMQVATSSCPPQLINQQYTEFSNYCSRSNAFALSLIEKMDIQYVIMAQRKDHLKTNWKEISDYLKENNVKNILVLGPAPTWVQTLPNIVSYYGLYKKQQETSTSIGLNKTVQEIDSKFAATLSLNEDIIFLSLINILCKEECLYKIKGAPAEDNLTQVDKSHLSIRGSRLVAQDLFKGIFN